MLLSDVFAFVEKNNLKGYIITCNSDIFSMIVFQNYTILTSMFHEK